MKRELIHKFLKDDNNKEYVINRLNQSIDFRNLINGKHIEKLEIIYYENDRMGFSGFEDKYELVARMGLSNMHYIFITKEHIGNIGFSSKEYEISLLIFDDIEKEIRRNENLEQLLD